MQYNLTVKIMKKIGNVLKRHRKLVKVIILFVLLSLIISFIIFKRVDDTKLISEIKNIDELLLNHKINYILPHFIIMALLFSSFCIGLGLILFPLYILFELVSVGYNIIIFSSIFKFRGFIYAIFYNILTKALYIFLICLLFKKLIEFLKVIIAIFSNKEDISSKYLLKLKIKKIIIVTSFILLNDILIYLFANRILMKLTTILK